RRVRTKARVGCPRVGPSHSWVMGGLVKTLSSPRCLEQGPTRGPLHASKKARRLSRWILTLGEYRSSWAPMPQNARAHAWQPFQQFTAVSGPDEVRTSRSLG